MPSSCAMKGCKNYDKRFKKEHGITYHRFPSEPTRKEIWCRILRKQRRDPYFTPAMNTRICSAHFCEEDFSISKRGLRMLKSTAVPRYVIEVEVASDSPILPVPTQAPSAPQDSVQAQYPTSDDPLFVDISDLNPLFDSPMIVHLKKRIEKLEKVLSLQTKKIKCLQKQNKRLMVKNKSLVDTNKALMQERMIMLEIESMETKVEKTEPVENYSTNISLNPPKS